MYVKLSGKDGCNAHLTASNGTITSPGYPAPYKNNLNCTTRITVAPGKQVHLVFSAFSLETGSGADNCEYDFVQIIDGSSSSKYCGGSERPPFFLSKTNELTIRFVTDDAATDAGFSAAYKAVDGAYIHSHQKQMVGKPAVSMFLNFYRSVAIWSDFNEGLFG